MQTNDLCSIELLEMEMFDHLTVFKHVTCRTVKCLINMSRLEFVKYMKINIYIYIYIYMYIK